MRENVLSHAWKAYLENIKLISLFSIPSFIAFLIPIFVNTPVFSAMGASFLRTGSIPDTSMEEMGIIILGVLASLYLVSFAIVNINIVIKAQRTNTSIKKEVIKGITGYTLNVFSIFLLGTVALLIVQLLTFEIGAQRWLAPMLSLILWMPLFYAPAGIVIDDLRPFRAAQKSINIIVSKFPYFLLWLLIAFILLAVLDFAALSLLPHKIGPLVVLLVNSMFLMPFLIVFQTQIYLSKYTILD